MPKEINEKEENVKQVRRRNKYCTHGFKKKKKNKKIKEREEEKRKWKKRKKKKSQSDQKKSFGQWKRNV